MLDIGWMEMAIIALVALVVIGPKDLPKAMRSVAKWVRKARSLSREFQSGLDEMMREAELDEAKKSIESVRRYNVDKLVEEELDPTGSVSRELKDIDDSARDRPGSKGTAAKQVAKAAPGAAPAAAPAAGEAPAAAEAGGTPAEGGGETSAATAEAAPEPAARRGKGRVVSHPAQIAPGNSVKPPAAAPAEAPAEAAPAESAVPDKASRKASGSGGGTGD